MSCNVSRSDYADLICIFIIKILASNHSEGQIRVVTNMFVAQICNVIQGHVIELKDMDLWAYFSNIC